MSIRPAKTLFQFKGNKRTVEPTVEPITLEEVCNHLRLDDAEDNEYLLDLMTVAREFVEEKTNLAFNTQTWFMTIDHWPGYEEPWWDGVREGAISELYADAPGRDIYLPVFPLNTVDTINVYDEDSNATAVTVSTVFDVDINSKVGRMTLKKGQTWPIATRANNAIEITYTSGYGNGRLDVPAPLRRALLEFVAYLYEHRGDCTMEQGFSKSGMKMLVRPYTEARL